MKVKTLLSLFVFFLALFSSFSCSRKENGSLPDSFRIIPQPRDIEVFGGRGLSYGELNNLVKEGEFDRPVMGQILSLLPETGRKKTGTLTLMLNYGDNVPESSEGYTLTISRGNAEVVSSGTAGLFYGCQTLEQLLEDSRNFKTAIPSCKITDYPEMEYRAVQFDVKNHLDHMRVYYDAIDRLSRYKINAVIFEFEDKLRYKRQPLIGAPQSISIDEMAALTQYARARHIEISPLVQGLGHATFIHKHDHYNPLRELSYSRWEFCPLKEGTYEVLFDMYLDAMEATPGARYIHVGGDEIGNVGSCPRCKPIAEKEGVLSLYLHWLKRVCDFVIDNGRTPLFWDSTPTREAGVHWGIIDNNLPSDEFDEKWKKGESVLQRLVTELPLQSIHVRSNYSMATQKASIRGIDWYQKNGLNLWMSTAAQAGSAALFPFDDRDKGIDSRGLPAIHSHIQLAAEKGISGMLCTAWDDRSLHMETHWRGLIASAEYSWNPDGKDLDEYDLTWQQREFGTSIPDFSALYRKLREAAVVWERAFYARGSRLDLNNLMLNEPHLAHWLPAQRKEEIEESDFKNLFIELPDLENPGKWSGKYSERLEMAMKVLEDYKETSELLDHLYRNSLNNRYHWQVYIALNDFQINAPRLLSALKQCDTAEKEAINAGKEEVGLALAEFDKAWKILDEVYSKSRFTSYPSDYVPDRFFHFASQKEDLTYMIQSEEVFHGMVVRWLGDQQAP